MVKLFENMLNECVTIYKKHSISSMWDNKFFMHAYLITCISIGMQISVGADNIKLERQNLKLQTQKIKLT
jgi:hypothetical protein